MEGDFSGPKIFENNDPSLFNAAKHGSLRTVDVLCHSRKKKGLLMNWEGAATMNLLEGYAHLGLPAHYGVSLGELLRRTFTMAKSIAPWGYGIGYSRSSLKAPCMYAVGVGGGSLESHLNETEEERERIGCWYREMRYHRHHLEGHLRDVYPANLLSNEHVNARVGQNKTLLTAGWGEFATIDDGLWIWTVPDEVIPKARDALVRAKVLLCP
jgi:hypothetical protein